MMAMAFDFSEAIKEPVLLRVVTRLAHSRASVEVREPRKQNKMHPSTDQWVLLPGIARKKYDVLIEKQEQMLMASNKSQFNASEYTDYAEKAEKTGIVACGIGYNYVKEALAQLPEEKRRLLLELISHGMLPKVIVTYRRIPFIYNAGNVRITFDGDITSSDETSRLLTRDYRQRPVLPPGKSILEVKWDELLPLHIKSMMQLDTLQWSTFSKYYTCRLIGF